MSLKNVHFISFGFWQVSFSSQCFVGFNVVPGFRPAFF